MERNKNVVICPPCGENVALATKRGANKENLFGALLPRLTAVLPQSGKTNLITLLWHCVPLPPHRGEDDKAITSLPQGREITTHGFTLIELLVVVLIIGILAAVAVPQYKKAVVKSQYMSLKPLVRSIVEAQKRYYLENGTYAAKFEDLDISLSMPTRSFFQSNNDYYEYPWGKLIIDNSHAAGFIDTKFKIRYELYIDGQQQCMIDKNYEIGHKICKEDSGLSSPSSSYGTQDIYWY